MIQGVAAKWSFSALSAVVMENAKAGKQLKQINNN